MRTWPVLPLLLACGLAHAATVYRWTDENGRVHYSQAPPAGLPYERVNPRAPSPGPKIAPPPIAPTAPAAASTAKPEKPAAPVDPTTQFLQDAEARRKAKAEERAKAAAALELAERQCADSRKRLAFLETQRPNLIVPEADGKVSRMNDEQFGERRDEAAAHVEQHCR